MSTHQDSSFLPSFLQQKKENVTILMKCNFFGHAINTFHLSLCDYTSCRLRYIELYLGSLLDNYPPKNMIWVWIRKTIPPWNPLQLTPNVYSLKTSPLPTSEGPSVALKYCTLPIIVTVGRRYCKFVCGISFHEVQIFVWCIQYFVPKSSFPMKISWYMWYN